MNLKEFSLQPLDNYLIFLKRYNSWKGLLPNIKLEYKGAVHSVTPPICGGLLYVSKHEGIAVIDMGPKFLTALNMYVNRCHSSDPSLNKINWKYLISVLITHFHVDHWGEFPYLVSLFFKWNAKLKTTTNCVTILTLCGSRQTITNLKEIMISFAKYNSKGQSFNFGRYYALSPDGTHLNAATRLGDHIKSFPLVNADWRVTRTEHMEVRNECTGVGFLITLKNGKKVGITGDTAYSEAISKQFKNVDLLVLNVGDFERKVGRFPQDQHMKLFGAKRFIEDVKPKIAVVTELDAAEAGDRLTILKTLNVSKVKILIGDIGLTIRLSDFHIRCDACGQFITFGDISQKFILEKETGDYSIQNFCLNCLQKLGKEISGSL